jgi:hypothetical protein
MCFSPFFYGYDFAQLTVDQRKQLKDRLEAEIASTEFRLEDMKRILDELKKLDQ